MPRSKSEEWPPPSAKEAFRAILDVVDTMREWRRSAPVDDELETIQQAAEHGLSLLKKKGKR